MIIRPATAADALAAMPLVYSAGPEAFDYIYNVGRYSAQDWLRYSLARRGGFFGYGAHHVAEQDGRVVGTASIYSRGDYKQMTRETVPATMRFYKHRVVPVMRRSLAMVDWMTPPERDMLYLANLGVDPEMRGQGVGVQLLEFGRDLARQRGKARFALDVADINPRAQALYERFGMKQVAETPFAGPRRDGHSVPVARRMVCGV